MNADSNDHLDNIESEDEASHHPGNKETTKDGDVTKSDLHGEGKENAFEEKKSQAYEQPQATSDKGKYAMTEQELHPKPAVEKVKERAGLTTAEAEKLYETVGFNELPHVEVSLVWMFFSQFTGVMPYMLEIASILALAVQSYPDFAIIAGILICNGCLGFHEELNAKRSLVSLSFPFFSACFTFSVSNRMH
jgi:magnesium-transporting ATPase (P-type)